MNTSLINTLSSILLNHGSYLIKDRIFPTLTPLQKKVFLIASLAFSFLGTCYVIWNICLKARNWMKKESEELAEKEYFDFIKATVAPKFEKSGSNHKRPPELSLKATEEIHETPKSEDSPSHIALQLQEDFEKRTLHISLEQRLTMAKQAGKFLTAITFQGVELTDQILQEVLKACPNLEMLDLANCSMITDEGLKELPTSLRTLRLPYCDKVKGKSFQNLPTGLQKLDLAFCIQIRNEHLRELPKGLLFLNIPFCKEITGEVLKALPQKLQTLNLSFCGQIEDKDLENLPETLQHLLLSHCSKITNGVVKNLPPNLQRLNLSECNLLTDEGLEHLPESLNKLTLSHCTKFTENALKHLPKSLEFLDISGCDKIAADALKELPKELVIVK